MSIDLPSLKEQIVSDLAKLVSEEEGLDKFASKVTEALQALSTTSRFNTMFTSAINDTHTKKVISHIIATYILKNYIKARVNITLKLDD